MKKFQAIEGNAGDLHLFVFGENGKVVWGHEGYEYNPGELVNDIQLIKDGADPENEWEGNVENPEKAYDFILSHAEAYGVVADNDGIYPENMGVEAMYEFGIAR